MTKNSESRLFRVESSRSRDYVLLNWLGEPIDHFGLYAEAYHKAGQKLVQEYGTTGALRDFEAAPIVFLYRHAFELYLKAVALVGSKIIRLQGKDGMAPDRVMSSHRLTEFVPHVCEIIRAAHWSWDMGVDGLRTEADFSGLVQELDAIDPGSYTFRYPTDRDGESALPEHFAFNVRSFATRLDPLLESLSGAVTGLEERWKLTAEAAYEARQYEDDRA